MLPGTYPEEQEDSYTTRMIGWLLEQKVSTDTQTRGTTAKWSAAETVFRWVLGEAWSSWCSEWEAYSCTRWPFLRVIDVDSRYPRVRAPHSKSATLPRQGKHAAYQSYLKGKALVSIAAWARSWNWLVHEYARHAPNRKLPKLSHSAAQKNSTLESEMRSELSLDERRSLLKSRLFKNLAALTAYLHRSLWRLINDSNLSMIPRTGETISRWSPFSSIAIASCSSDRNSGDWRQRH